FARMDERFEAAEQRRQELRQDMLARFEQVDKRFEQVDKRFEQADQRFEALTRRIDRFMIWSFGTTVTVGGLVVTLVKFWNP
ncbi:hypothetical protein CKO31_23315, partial [Thiohalocapsa halophila]|nr:hypothetical protein [Thiohalocapsa halophila]